ncbi:hypothetical protein K431DRAFT_293381 [Polychaeton citri CBS 116435]|uniref:Uncharacterized protein n=1 Tax=Polychaeton citri CBS 116435 TaxID=1314669 RepID=A0A9P4URX5_9PEZI|nr:hypothetical protein K431DRAFT_293381 [Polychaeton citri CBS 116435]
MDISTQSVLPSDVRGTLPAIIQIAQSHRSSDTGDPCSAGFEAKQRTFNACLRKALTLFKSAILDPGTLYDVLRDEDKVKNAAAQDIFNAIDITLTRLKSLEAWLSGALSDEVKKYAGKRYSVEFQSNIDKWIPFGRKAVEVVRRTLDTTKLAD